MIHDRDIGIEAKVETGLGIMIVVIQEVEIDIGIDKPGQELELCQMTEGCPGHSQIQEWALIEIDSGATDVANMTTFPGMS